MLDNTHTAQNFRPGMYVCVYTYIHIHTYIHTYVRTYVHTYIQNVCRYMYICIHAHTHPQGPVTPHDRQQVWRGRPGFRAASVAMPSDADADPPFSPQPPCSQSGADAGKRVHRKIDSDGAYLPFPGITVVCNASASARAVLASLPGI